MFVEVQNNNVQRQLFKVYKTVECIKYWVLYAKIESKQETKGNLPFQRSMVFQEFFTRLYSNESAYTAA